AGRDRTARLWDATTGEPVAPPLEHGDELTHASFSPDGRWVVTASKDRTARLWDAATGEPLAPPLRHPATVAQVAFSPDGRRLLGSGFFDPDERRHPARRLAGAPDRLPRGLLVRPARSAGLLSAASGRLHGGRAAGGGRLALQPAHRR